MKPQVLLLTGFEPFGGDVFNPSGALAQQWQGHRLPGGVVIQGLVLPVSGPAAWRKLSHQIQQHRPCRIIAMGVSGRSEVSIESTAWNEMDYPIPDNAGLQPRRAAILPRGPAQLTSGLTALLESAIPGLERQAGSGLAIRSSTDPGRYVCNYLYYRLLHLTRRASHGAHQQAVFLHLPPTVEMRRSPQDPRVFQDRAAVQRVVLGLCEVPMVSSGPPGQAAAPAPAMNPT